MINSSQKAQIKKRLKRLQKEIAQKNHAMIAREKLTPALQESVDKLLARTAPAPEKTYLWEGVEYTPKEFEKAVKAVNSDIPCIILPDRGEPNSSEK